LRGSRVGRPLAPRLKKKPIKRGYRKGKRGDLKNAVDQFYERTKKEKSPATPTKRDPVSRKGEKSGLTIL